MQNQARMLTNVKINTSCTSVLKKNWKKLRKMIKMTIFGKTCLYLRRCHGNIKYHGHMVDIYKFPQRMNEQLLKVSAL